MKRLVVQERSNWQQIVEGEGFFFHTTEDGVYWNESAAYNFRTREIDLIEEASNELHSLCIQAIDFIIKNDRFEQMQIPDRYIPLIMRSWARQDLSLYGRFDLQFDGYNPPKMLEYNADTPTSLLEASVVQWKWMKDLYPEYDQFNSIHDKLVEQWKKIKIDNDFVHFACFTEVSEDLGNLEYLRDAAIEAGITTSLIDMNDISWSDEQQSFVDREFRKIKMLFKLYPWEWMLADEFAPYLLNEAVNIIEPAWKMLLSNKAILPILWEMFPGHPNLLPASFNRADISSINVVKKPIFSREGANIVIEKEGKLISTDGPYIGKGEIFQSYAPLYHQEGNHMVVGSWVIGGKAAGIGIREDRTLVTGNLSKFVPHFFSLR